MRESDAVVLTLLRELDEITVADRIRQATDLRVQERIDAELLARVGRYVDAAPHAITARLAELDDEWDAERALTLQSSVTGLAGLVLAAAGNRRWLMLTAVTTGFLFQHAVQGWCPPLMLQRRLGLRTRREIDLEIHMLKLLRGDFRDVPRAGTLDGRGPVSATADEVVQSTS
ncbi:MAG TPA: hypothetical protein VK939_01735 [Longimicrobiales bacterium]|nr:hypothetical protein [Longimicrobiales bacterium]